MVRHAASPARATVVIRYDDGGVIVEITDDGHGTGSKRSHGGGHGLAGMRERLSLLAAIRIIAAGDALLAPSVTRKLIREFARQAPPAPRPDLDVLTDREQDVLALVARGLANAEVATEVFITLAAVKTHVSRLLTKLAARDRAQLIVIAYESGFVTPA